MAVEQSVAQMALTRDTGPGGFMERTTAILATTAGSVLSEAATTPYHQGRALYAQRVVANPSQAATQGGPMIVMGVNITSTTIYDEGTKTATCTATDLQIQSQLMTFWNHLAGLDTPTA
jgi:flagellar hook protein FlgE